MVIIPIYLINLFKSVKNNIPITEVKFWTMSLEFSYLELALFVLITAFLFSTTIILITSKNRKVKNISSLILLSIFSINLILSAFHIYKFTNSFVIPRVSKIYLNVTIDRLMVVFISLFLIYNLKRKFNLKFYWKKSIKFIFFIAEMWIALFLGLLFKEYLLGDKIYWHQILPFYVVIFLIGFLFLIIIEIIKDGFKIE